MTARMEMLIEGLEQRVDERTLEAQRRSTQLAAAAELGSSIATIHQLDSLLNQVTSLITDKFGYYHCGIFFVDERAEYAVLQAANSEGGKRMLARGHKLGVGQTGIVGYVTAHGQARIALDVGFDAVYFDNPDLPETRSEIALPLIARGELLGALDVQSTEPAAFSEEDVEVLQLLADLIAVAIQNAQMMTRTQQALEAAQAAYGQFVQQAWAEKIHGKPEINFLSAAHFNGPTDEQWHPQSLAAYQTGQTVRGNGTAHRLAIPIKVRNTTIGVIDTFKPLESGDWTDEEIAMLENIISQLGIALESARLYEDTQLQAETERLLAQISSRMRATLDIDYVLQTAAQDLLRTFNLAEVEIRLEPEQSGRD
jgi:GAF domain-containing protein